MVLSFFRDSTGNGDFDHIVTKSVAMLNDARHSFDLATLALLTDAGSDAVSQDVRDTDRRINQAEQELRSELMVHVSVNGTDDIGSVLGFTVLIKKIERAGDHAKDILELVEAGVSLADVPETERLMAERQALLAFFTEAGELLTEGDPGIAAVQDYADRINASVADYQAHIDSYICSKRPGEDVVPLAITYRYLRRIAANLLGVARTGTESIPQSDG